MTTAVKKPTEIERVACTILAYHLKQGDAVDPVVREFVEAVISGKGLDHEDVKRVGERRSEQAGQSFPAYPPIYYHKLMNDRIIHLACSVVFYRWENRPEGDQVVELGFGVAISTSLAAAVAEFHTASVRARYYFFNDDGDE